MIAAIVPTAPVPVKASVPAWATDAGRYHLSVERPGVYRVVKRLAEDGTRLERPDIYFTDGRRCSCPASGFADCKHRKLVRLFLALFCCPTCGQSLNPLDFEPAFCVDPVAPAFDVLELVCRNCEARRRAAGRGGWIAKSTRPDWLGRYLTREEAALVAAVQRSYRRHDPLADEEG